MLLCLPAVSKWPDLAAKKDAMMTSGNTSFVDLAQKQAFQTHWLLFPSQAVSLKALTELKQPGAGSVIESPAQIYTARH